MQVDTVAVFGHGSAYSDLSFFYCILKLLDAEQSFGSSTAHWVEVFCQ